MLKTLMTSTALTLALTAPIYAQEVKTDMDADMDTTVEMAENETVMDVEADESVMAETDMEMDADADTMEVAEGDMDMDADMDSETSVVADTDAIIPEDMDGEETMTVTADTLNGETDAVDDTTTMADADMSDDAGLEQLSQFTGMTVDEIVGLNVMSADGEDVGEIDYVISDGQGYEAVIGIGGFLGLGEYTVAMPLGNFAMTDGELILDSATEEELEAMPEIDESELEALDGDYVIS